MSPQLLVCAPLWVEALALRPKLGARVVERTGYGPGRSARSAAALARRDFDAMAVAGLAGGLGEKVRSGDVVVADEVRGPEGTTRCPSAPLLAGELRRQGFVVHCGPIVSKEHVVRGEERTALARSGALAVDMESSTLTEIAGDRPVAVVRVIVDTSCEPLLDVGTPYRAWKALRRLNDIAPVLDRWADSVGSRRALLPAPRSLCAGVERAIEIVERALLQRGAPVYVRKQIVHNEHVVADLSRRGAVFVDELAEVPEGATVVFSAHGVSPAVRSEAEERALKVVDATCPLVAKVHAEARRYTRDAGTVLLIGHEGHEEVEGTIGEAPDNIVLVQSEEDAEDVEVADPARVTYLMQTTLSVEESADIVDRLRRRFPALKGPDKADICYATSNRQAALQSVADRADLVLVVGSENSSNSVRLVETAARGGTPAHLVPEVGDVRLRWLRGVTTVGITAGASAPPHLVGELVDALRGLGSLEVTEHVVTEENIQFGLPKEVC